MTTETMKSWNDLGHRRRYSFKPLAMLTILPLLGGCAVGPDYAMPIFDLPSHWSQGGKKQLKATDLSQWWKRLSDPTLNALVQKAVENNLDLAQAKGRLRQAREARLQTESSLFPSLDGSASATRAKTVSTGRIGNAFQVGFDASWEIDLFGGNRRNSEAAARSEEAVEADLRDTLVSLIAEIASNYVEARGYQARIQLARRTADSQFETAKLTRTKLDAGTGTSVDLAKAQATAYSTEANIPTLQTALTAAINRISVLIAEPPTSLAGSFMRNGSIPAPRALPTGIPADVLRFRPDVEAAERRLAQQTALIGVAEAARYPSISLTGAVSTTATKIGDLGKSSTIGWSWGPSLSVPIFNAGRLSSAVREQEAARDVQAAALKSAILVALEDVENALVGLAQERIRTGRLTQSASNYRDAARLSRSLYQQGSSDFLDVLDADRSLYSAEDTLIQSRVNATSYFIALCKALGGGWDALEGPKKPVVAKSGQ